MADVHTKKQRSYNMSRIRSRGTGPEPRFRKYIWKKGIRGYRIKNKINGNPDLYFPISKAAVFIDGCFWHKCPECFIEPSSNRRFWKRKIGHNIKRDIEVNGNLSRKGVKVFRFWEHEVLNNLSDITNRVIKYVEKEKER